MNDRARGALLGLAVGDALGTTYEFERIDQPAYPALARGPATDIVGGGPFDLVAGQVTDDTQLAVCLARGLHEKAGLELADLAARYVAWTEEAFDIGNQTRNALDRIEQGETIWGAGVATWRASGRRAAGNGSLMRTAPIAVALRDAPAQAVIDAAIADSMITHADPRCVLACAAFDAVIAAVIARPMSGPELVAFARTSLARAAETLTELWTSASQEARSAADAVGAMSVDRDDLGAIPAAKADLERDLDAALRDDPDLYGSELHLHRTAGFVRVAFRLAFWHAAHTASWRDALVDVASRGGDADTNAAIVGALLGARDGARAIPPAWIERVLAVKQRGSDAWADAHHPRHLLALL